MVLHVMTGEIIWVSHPEVPAHIARVERGIVPKLANTTPRHDTNCQLLGSEAVGTAWASASSFMILEYTICTCGWLGSTCRGPCPGASKPPCAEVAAMPIQLRDRAERLHEDCVA